jgi:hypothetical protein
VKVVEIVCAAVEDELRARGYELTDAGAPPLLLRGDNPGTGANAVSG